VRALLLVCVVALTALPLVACDDEATEQPALADTTPTPTATPLSREEALLQRLRDFAPKVQQAIDDGDAVFFSRLGIQIEVLCQGDEQAGVCAGQPVNTHFRGIPGTAWQSDAVTLLSPDELTTAIEQWLASALPGESDEYGDGAPRVYALARWPGNSPNGEFLTIVTLIGDAGTGAGVQRQARIFRWVPVRSGLSLNGEALAADAVTAADWLDGDCTDCYDHWELWEGAP
jgi:hypothetical protein